MEMREKVKGGRRRLQERREKGEGNSGGDKFYLFPGSGSGAGLWYQRRRAGGHKIFFPFGGGGAALGGDRLPAGKTEKKNSQGLPLHWGLSGVIAPR